MFDLPVTSKSQRRAALRFRNHLLELGFEMVQFSIYARHCYSRERVDTLVPKIKAEVPEDGKVKILTITDKQFSQIQHFGKGGKKPVRARQLTLF